jgi:hypothetical protein
MVEPKTEKIDIKKILGDPKITFVIGTQRSRLIFFRRTSLWQGNAMRKARGGIWIHPHFNWRFDAP